MVGVVGCRRCRGSSENYGGTACVPLCMRGERSSQKRGFASKCANVLKPRRNTYQSHHAGREPPSILSVINY